MRLTTKIVLGIIAVAFLIAIGCICYLSLSYDGERKIGFTLKKETIAIDISGQKVIEIYADTIAAKNRYSSLFEGCINIQPSSEEKDKGKLYLPEQLKPYLETSVSGSTTILRIKTAELIADHRKDDVSKPFGIFGLNMTIYADSSINVISKLAGVRALAKDLKVESISIDLLQGDLEIENCEADIITPVIRDWGRLVMKNSKTKVFNADLDYLQEWKIKQCDIDVENLTGSGNHDVNIPATECRVMNWNPKKEKASLKVSLGADTARVVFP